MYQRLIWIKTQQRLYSVKESSRLRLARLKTELHVRKVLLPLQGVFWQRWHQVTWVNPGNEEFTSSPE